VYKVADDEITTSQCVYGVEQNRIGEQCVTSVLATLSCGQPAAESRKCAIPVLTADSRWRTHSNGVG